MAHDPGRGSGDDAFVPLTAWKERWRVFVEALDQVDEALVGLRAAEEARGAGDPDSGWVAAYREHLERLMREARDHLATYATIAGLDGQHESRN